MFIRNNHGFLCDRLMRISYGADIEVLEPQSLRQEMLENAKMTMALYDERAIAQK